MHRYFLIIRYSIDRPRHLFNFGLTREGAYSRVPVSAKFGDKNKCFLEILFPVARFLRCISTSSILGALLMDILIILLARTSQLRRGWDTRAHVKYGFHMPPTYLQQSLRYFSACEVMSLRYQKISKVFMADLWAILLSFWG